MAVPNRNSGARRPKSEGIRQIRIPGHPRGIEFVVRGHEVTHAVVPIRHYERLLTREEIIRSTAVLDDSDGPWIPLEDAVAQVAAHDIVKARKKAGLTQAQLAAKLKMPQSQISRIESNPDRTTVRTLKKIAKALGVDVRYLL